MSNQPSALQKAVADARRHRLQNGAVTDPQFVSGDVQPGTIRPVADEATEPER